MRERLLVFFFCRVAAVRVNEFRFFRWGPEKDKKHNNNKNIHPFLNSSRERDEGAGFVCDYKVI